jgi:hypothetical protein
VLGEDQPVRAALAAVLCLLVSGCLPVVGSSPQQGFATPRVGQCYATPDDVLADPHDSTPPVDCSNPHTLETYAVLHPAHRLDRETMARMDQQCVQRIKAFLGGGDFAQTAVSVYYFTPTTAQRRDGGLWVRCDAGVVTDTAVSGARPVTGSLRGAFAHGVPEAYRRCLDGAPDPAAALPLVPCTGPHVAEQMPSGVDLGDAGARYPGTSALTHRANDRCARVVQAQVPEAARSLVVVPTASMWRGGVTTAQCWALAPPGERLGQSEAKPA